MSSVILRWVSVLTEWCFCDWIRQSAHTGASDRSIDCAIRCDKGALRIYERGKNVYNGAQYTSSRSSSPRRGLRSATTMKSTSARVVTESTDRHSLTPLSRP